MLSTTFIIRSVLAKRSCPNGLHFMRTNHLNGKTKKRSSSTLASVKLSDSLKRLISSTDAHGGPTPSPGSGVIFSLFDLIRQQASEGEIGDETWLTLGTATLCTLNSPSALCELWNYAGNVGVEKTYAAEVMREVGLKCISFNGIPRTINNLGALYHFLPEEVRKELNTAPTRYITEDNVDEVQMRGKALWDSIYEPHSAKLISRLSESHPDMPVYILSSHYGPLLSDPLDSSTYPFRLGRVLTSIVAIACLRAQTGVEQQVTSHVFGLLKAGVEGGGGQTDSVKGKTWLTSEEGAKWVLESTDKIVKVFGKEVTESR